MHTLERLVDKTAIQSERKYVAAELIIDLSMIICYSKNAKHNRILSLSAWVLPDFGKNVRSYSYAERDNGYVWQQTERRFSVARLRLAPLFYWD